MTSRTVLDNVILSFFAKGFKEVEMNASGSKDFPIDFVAILHQTGT